MANKLAGQRAKFSRARALFYASPESGERERAALRMAEVIADAPAYGFSEEDVTQGEDVPDAVRRLRVVSAERPDEDTDVERLFEIVDTRSVVEIGSGTQSVYAYGYACAPDRLPRIG